MASASLREISIPRFALRRDEVAASLAISPSLVDIWIKEGRLPKGRKIGGVLLWDTERVRAAWLRMAEEEIGVEDDGDNPFDAVVA